MMLTSPELSCIIIDDIEKLLGKRINLDVKLPALRCSRVLKDFLIKHLVK